MNERTAAQPRDRKSTRLNSSHLVISYAVFCLKKKTKNTNTYTHERTPSERTATECRIHVRPGVSHDSVLGVRQVLLWFFFFCFFFFKEPAPPQIPPLSPPRPPPN